MAVVSAGASLGGFAGGSVLSRLLVVISGDTSSLQTALAQAQSQTLTFSQKTGAMGNALTRSVSLPALAAAGSMIFLNTQFSKSLGTIAALTPVVQSGEESIQSLSDKILTLAKELPTAPDAIARSFYLAASAGLETNEAFQIVELSAKGAALGMGEAADISTVLIAALNNYGDAGLTAESAMDSLTAAIREGTAEPAELAVALGRLLPVAEQAGVAFDEVVGSVAALTNLGVPARVATTSLRALFSQLLAPTIQATDTLRSLGLTADDVRKALTLGPLAAFELVNEATGENADLTRQLIPQIRGLTAYYGLTGDKLDEYRHILDETKNSQGDFQRAFEEIQKQPSFQFEVAINQLRVAAIEMGAKAIPVFNKLIEGISATASSLSSLPGPAKSAFISLLLLAGVSGPMLKLVSAMTAVTEKGLASNAAVTRMVPTTKALATNFGVMGIAGLVAAGSLIQISNGATDLITVLTALVGTAIALRSALMLLQTAFKAAMMAGLIGVNALTAGFASLSGLIITGVAVALGALITAIIYFNGQADRTAKAAREMGAALASGAQSGESMKETLENITDEGQRKRMEALVREVGDLQNIMNLQNEPTADVLPMVQTESIERFRTMLAAAAEDLRAFGSDEGGGDEIAANIEDVLLPALLKSAEAGVSLDDALAQAGSSSEGQFEFMDRLNDFATLYGKNGVGAEGILADALAFDTFQEKAKIAATAAIAGFDNEANAIETLAKTTGTSADFIEGKLNMMGTTATEVIAGDSVDAFVLAAGGTEDLSLATRQAADEIEAAWGKMTEALVDDFNIFGEMPDAANKSLTTYMNNAAKLSRVAVTQAQDIATLQEKGVPTGLIDQLIAAGPSMVSKFAGATKAQLKNLVGNYEIALAAMDSSILKEAEHQAGKGEGMVQGFADAILGSKHLTDAAAQQLMYGIGAEIAKGQLRPEAVRMLTGFVQALNQGRKLSSAAASRIITAAAAEFRDKHNFNADGKLIVARVTAGIAESTNLPRAKVAEMIRGVVEEVNNKKPQIKEVGRQVSVQTREGLGTGADGFIRTGQNYIGNVIEGMNLGAPGAFDRARQIAEQMNTAFREGLHNSPKMGSYYAGIEYAKQFSQGVDKGGFKPTRPVHIMGPAPKAAGWDQLGGGRGGKRSVHAKLERRRFDEDFSYSRTYEGWR